MVRGEKLETETHFAKFTGLAPAEASTCLSLGASATETAPVISGAVGGCGLRPQRKGQCAHAGVGGVSSPLQVILPWLTVSEKAHEQSRAAGTISRMLRFICNFPELSVSQGVGGGGDRPGGPAPLPVGRLPGVAGGWPYPTPKGHRPWPSELQMAGPISALGGTLTWSAG